MTGEKAKKEYQTDGNSPLVSVIMPAYNAERTLAASAQSVLSQSLEDLELIIIDDGSKDGTAMVCGELAAQDERVRFIKQTNAGPAAARNAGLAGARGEYVTFVDSDDLIEKGMLASLVEAVRSSGADVAVCGAAAEYPGSAEKNFEIRLGTEGLFYGSERKKLFDLPWMTIFLSGWGKLFRRSIIEQKALRLNTEYRITEDTDFVMRYLENCSGVHLVDECFYRYVQANGNSLTSVKDPEALRAAAYNIRARLACLMQKWGVCSEEANGRADEYLYGQLNSAVFIKLRGNSQTGEKLRFYKQSFEEKGFKAYLSHGKLSSRILGMGFLPALLYTKVHGAYLRLRGRA